MKINLKLFKKAIKESVLHKEDQDEILNILSACLDPTQDSEDKPELPKVEKKMIDIDKFVELADKIKESDKPKIEKLEEYYHVGDMPFVIKKLNEVIKVLNSLPNEDD